MAVITRSQNGHRAINLFKSENTPKMLRKRPILAKRKIKEAEAAAGSLSSNGSHRKAAEGSSSRGSGSALAPSRPATGRSTLARKPKAPKPYPQIRIQTSQISGPLELSPSPRHDDDFLDTHVHSGPTTLVESLRAHREADTYARPMTATKYESAEASEQLSRRGTTLSRKYSVRQRRAGTSDSMDSPLPTSKSATASPVLHAGLGSVRPATASATVSNFAATASDAPRSPPLASPTTPTSMRTTLSSSHSPAVPRSPASMPRSATTPVTRLRRAGTLTGIRSPLSQPSGRLRATSNDTSPPRDREYTCESPNHFELSDSTIFSVVSVSPTDTAKPLSIESRSSNNSGAIASKRATKKPATDEDELRGPPPRDDWDIVFDRIREYRATHEAPVDTVGCEALTEEEKDPTRRRFRSLISLMLSAQTKDEITAEAVRTLSKRLPGGLTPKSLSDAPIDTVRECIRRVGFWQRKANYIKEAARTCLEQYNGDIPRTIPQLLSLPGVGPKMAYLAMHAAWHEIQGIGVDTHVLRISHRLGWVEASAKTPEATRHSLESWLPKSLWQEINTMLVGLGQTVCKAVGPKCGECPVSQYCPSSQAKSASQTKRKSKAGSSSGSSNTAGDGLCLSQDTVYSESGANAASSYAASEGLAGVGAGVDVEDLASIVRGGEHAVRSRKLSGSRSRKNQIVAAKKAFPSIPNSPAIAKRFFRPGDDESVEPHDEAGPNTPCSSQPPKEQVKMPVLKDDDTEDGDSASNDPSPPLSSEEEEEEEGDADKTDRPSATQTPTTSHYFMRSRSNAASEEVRPEAKTDTVLHARAKARAAKVYSRRLSKSDMQWALGEDWDPEDDSSLSSLSDLDLVADPGDDL
ncbi:alpha,alpha-trehalase nth1 [Dipsacomyces acuminosporus]|nr:alpha,alpha-trehalase nth1 [Dipsacomyces acuminosporus]